MEKPFWLERWQKDEIGFHQADVNRYLKKYWKKVATNFPQANVFVPLCGKSLDMLWLKKQGHRVTGIELSQKAVQDFFSENALDHDITQQAQLTVYSTDQLNLLCGDFFEINNQLLANHHLVYDRASLVALPEPMRKSYAEHLSQVLPEKASILQVIMTYPQHEMTGPPFSVSEAELRSLYADKFNIEKLAEYDIFRENPRFQDKGMTQLIESVFIMSR